MEVEIKNAKIYSNLSIAKISMQIYDLKKPFLQKKFFKIIEKIAKFLCKPDLIELKLWRNAFCR